VGIIMYFKQITFSIKIKLNAMFLYRRNNNKCGLLKSSIHQATKLLHLKPFIFTMVQRFHDSGGMCKCHKAVCGDDVDPLLYVVCFSGGTCEIYGIVFLIMTVL
jgi:hypothetical protein